MGLETFSLQSREEVVRFDELLDTYAKERSGMQFGGHISLTNAFDYLQRREDGDRIFSALLDIQINFILLWLDLSSVGGTWNAFFSRGKLKGGSILDSPVKFFGKMDVHRFCSSYVFRYRAIWDKIMGLIILIDLPEEYDDFSSSRSKKRAFGKITNKYQLLKNEDRKYISELLTSFDDKFRTPEAHGSGRLRKYSLTMTPMETNPQAELIYYWNELNRFIIQIGKIFEQ